MSAVLQAPQLIRSGVANDTGRLRPTLQHTLEAALSISDAMIDELLGALAPVCHLDRQGPLPLGLELVDVARVERLIASADALKRDWHQQLRQVFYQGQGAEAGSPGVRFDDLRLLDDQQINASIEFATTEQALLGPAAELLPRLNALVSNLMGWLTVQPDLNPLRPQAYALALRALMAKHVPDPRQRSALYAPVASILGESLRQVYRELIQWLLAHGVEPLQSPNTRLAPDQPPSQALGRTLLTLSRLRQLLAGDLNAPAQGGPAFLHTVPASMTALEDMDLIEPLLQRLRQRPRPPVPSGAFAANLPELPVVSGQNLGRLLGQEVVRLMLENLTHDQRLLPAIRQQVGLLEPALVRLSLAEPRFFSERQHPARQLLEAITQRSLGYQSHADEGFAPLLQSVRAAVRSINRVEVSEAIFARLLRRLRARWKQDDTLKLQRRADAARALLHAEQRQILAERLAADYLQRLHGKEVPEFVQRFLTGPWAQAVAEAQLDPAPAGEAGEPLDGVAEELIWSVQPALIRRDVDRLGQLVPRLVAQLREGLQRIGYPAELTGPFLDALVALHEKAFDTPTLTAVPFIELTDVVVPVPQHETHQDPSDDGLLNAPEPTPEPELETFWIAGQAAEDAGFVDAVSGPMPLEPLAAADLDTGAWVDLKVQGEWVRAQLTWTSPRGGLYMFISAKGLAHSMTRRTLDRLLGNDALRIVSRGGVVESALDAVAQQALRNTQGADGEAAAPDTPTGDN